MATKRISELPAAGALTGEELIEVSQLSDTILISAATISAAATDNSFNDSADGFITAGFSVGDRVNVTGFTGDEANNLLVGAITALTAGKMTIGGTDGDGIVDDAAGETVVISKWVSRRATAQDVADLGGPGGGGDVPTGGTTGQVLAKASDTDGDTAWVDQASGGGGNWWFNPPAAADFTLTSGDGTNPILTDDTDAGLLFDFGAFTAGDDNRFAYELLSSPTLDWEVTVAFRALLLDTAIGFGIGIMDSASGKVITCLVRDTGWRFYNWNSLTSFGSLASANFAPGGMSSRGLYWLRAKRVSGNIYFQASVDGKQWFQVGTTTTAAFLGTSPNRLGLIGNYATTSYRGYAAVEYYSLTGPAV